VYEQGRKTCTTDAPPFKVHMPRVSLGKVGILNSDVDQRQTRPHTQDMLVFGLQTVTQTPM
jgi:hypothetical protein